jgi:hypothetical protein
MLMLLLQLMTCFLLHPRSCECCLTEVLVTYHTRQYP